MIDCLGMQPDPRASASLAIKGDQLYLFGGSVDYVDSNDLFSYDLSKNYKS